MNILQSLKMAIPIIAFQFRIRLILLLIMFFQSAHSIAGMGEGIYYKQRLEIVEKIKTILMTDKICKSEAECTTKKIVFAGPKASGVVIQLYEPIGKVSLPKILYECSNYFVNSNMKMNIDIEIFDVTKEEELNQPIWKFVRPGAVIHFIGKK